MPSAKNQHGKFALSLVDENGHNLPEYRVEATGRDIVVIKPDQPFRVKVGIYARPIDATEVIQSVGVPS